MFGDTESNPYISLVEEDMLVEENRVHVNLGEDSVTRRVWDYEQNDFKRYFARHNPLGSEEKFMELRGEVIGETIYSAFEKILGEEEPRQIYFHYDQGSGSISADPESASVQTIRMLGKSSERSFYRSALETVQDEAYSEASAQSSEI